MKSALIILTSFVTTGLFAQKSKNAFELPKQKTIVSKAEMVQNLDMGMGMMMNTTTNNTTEYVVIAQNGDEYTVTRKMVAAKVNMDMMGQSQKYDSDMKEDADSEIGKEVGKKLNVTDTLSYNPRTGKTVLLTKAEADTTQENPMASMFKSIGSASDEESLENIFLPLDPKLKEGNNWVDSGSTAEMSYVKTYTLQSKSRNSNKVALQIETKNMTEVEAQGMPLNITLNKKTDATVDTDGVSSLISTKKGNSNIEGSMEIMGQSMPISGTVSITITNEVR
jgi:hypothetical protein